MDMVVESVSFLFFSFHFSIMYVCFVCLTCDNVPRTKNWQKWKILLATLSAFCSCRVYPFFIQTVKHSLLNVQFIVKLGPLSAVAWRLKKSSCINSKRIKYQEEWKFPEKINPDIINYHLGQLHRSLLSLFHIQ